MVVAEWVRQQTPTPLIYRTQVEILPVISFLDTVIRSFVKRRNRIAKRLRSSKLVAFRKRHIIFRPRTQIQARRTCCDDICY